MSSSYIQTASIDLVGESVDILAIGSNDAFAGVYDGGGHSSSNWVCEDNRKSLFKTVTSAHLNSMVLDGVWSSVCDTTRGFLAASCMNYCVTNITTSFATGT